MRQMYGYFRRNRAVTSIEYALIAALIALVIVIAISATGTNLGMLYNDILISIANALGGS